MSGVDSKLHYVIVALASGDDVPASRITQNTILNVLLLNQLAQERRRRDAMVSAVVRPGASLEDRYVKHKTA